MRNSKKERIKKFLKRHRDVSPYLLNVFSGSIYSHEDLDKLFELVEDEGYTGVSLWNGAVTLRGNRSELEVEARPLRSKKWGGKPHFTEIKRALRNPELKLFFDPKNSDHERFRFYSGPEYEIIVDTFHDDVYFWSNSGAPEEIETFKKETTDVFGSFEMKRNDWSYVNVAPEKRDDLIVLVELILTGNLPRTTEVNSVDLDSTELKVEEEKATVFFYNKKGEEISQTVAISYYGDYYVYDWEEPVIQIFKRLGMTEEVIPDYQAYMQEVEEVIEEVE